VQSPIQMTQIYLMTYSFHQIPLSIW